MFLWQPGKQPEALGFVQKIGLWGLIVVSLGLMFSSAVALDPSPEAQARVFGIVSNQIIAALFFFLALGLFLLVADAEACRPYRSDSHHDLDGDGCLHVQLSPVVYSSSLSSENVPEPERSGRKVDLGQTFYETIVVAISAGTTASQRLAWARSGAMAEMLSGSTTCLDTIRLHFSITLRCFRRSWVKFERTPEFSSAPDVYAPILDAASMKYLLIHDELQETEKVVFRPDKYSLVGQSHGVTAYLNQSFVPRAHVSPRILILPTGIPAAGFMGSPAFVPSEMALVEHSAAQDVPGTLVSPMPVVFLEAENFTNKSPQGRVVHFPGGVEPKGFGGLGECCGRFCHLSL